MNTTEAGRLAEQCAERQLISEGYQVIARNFRIRRAEIDLVCLRGDYLLFVEVKGRAVYRPDEAWLPFWRKKKWRLYAAARVFLKMYPEYECRAGSFGFEVLFVTQGRVSERFEEGGFF